MTTRVQQPQKTLWLGVFTLWIMAVVGVLGSLFFSEVMDFPPCKLCWYQRIFLYPLAVIFLVGLWRVSVDFFLYSVPLIIGGFLVSVYHNLLYYGVIPESAAPCRQGVSCTEVQIEWLGFITIPLMALAAFSVMAILIYFSWREFKK